MTYVAVAVGVGFFLYYKGKDIKVVTTRSSSNKKVLVLSFVVGFLRLK